MGIHNPTIPFADIFNNTTFNGRQAYDKVQSMSEEQVRYALWATLVILFGAEESNAPEVIRQHVFEVSVLPSMNDAALILAEIGIGKSRPDVIARARQFHKKDGQNE